MVTPEFRMKTFVPFFRLALFVVCAAAYSVQAKPDAIAAASLSVGTDSVTTTTVRIQWFNDRYNYGSRTLCYDPAPASPVSNCVVKTARANEGFFQVTGLTPGTAYNFSIKAINTRDTKDAPYTTAGTFTTLEEPIGVTPAAAHGVHAPVHANPEYDLRGRKTVDPHSHTGVNVGPHHGEPNHEHSGAKKATSTP
jgi:hypothetical protein